MKTVVIFNNFDEYPLTCAVIDGDFSELHEKYINSGDVSDKEADKINEVANTSCTKYCVDEWYVHKLPAFPSDEFYEAVKNGAKVIVTGCLP